MIWAFVLTGLVLATAWLMFPICGDCGHLGLHHSVKFGCRARNRLLGVENYRSWPCSCKHGSTIRSRWPKRGRKPMRERLSLLNYRKNKQAMARQTNLEVPDDE